MVDADYNFIYVDIGANGSVNDAQIFNNSPLGNKLQNNTLNMPPDHIVLGDSAFSLQPYLMKPYGSRDRTAKQTVFNYRLSRTYRIIENAFGILAWRFPGAHTTNRIENEHC